MFSLKPVLFILGALLCILSASMLIPAIVDLHHHSPDWQYFLTSSLITGFAGFFLIFSNRQKKIVMNLKQAILLTPLTWIMVSLFSAMPFFLSELNLTFSQAFFEASSGLTTTGATVIVGLDNAPKGILLWRAILQYLGGLGIIAAALIILPALGVGGMQIFKNESFGSDQKHLPRTSQVAKSLFGIYTFLCFLCAVLYYRAGMSGFDAITHSFFTVSTGGFANYDASFGYFDNVWIEIIAIVFMLLGAMPFIVFFRMLHGYPKAFLKDGQIKYLLTYLAIVILILAAWVDYNDVLKNSVQNAPISGTADSFFSTLRYVSFNIISMATTCGFVTTDYGLWGPFSQFMFIIVIIIGSCNGSTAGGIKIFRIRILFQTLKSQAKRLMSPNGVFRPKYDNKSLSDDVLLSVACYFFIYFVTLFISAGLLSLSDLDFYTIITSTAALLSNSGPGLGPISGPAGNYSTFSDYALLIGSIVMILGRLEILAFLVLLSPNFWRE